MMAAKKAQAKPVASSEPEASKDERFPHAVEPPFRAGWEHALTKKHGTRGKAWTSTKSEPQWIVHFADSEAAAWFENAWAAGERQLPS
jgi:hypothetical protein